MTKKTELTHIRANKELADKLKLLTEAKSYNDAIEIAVRYFEYAGVKPKTFQTSPLEYVNKEFGGLHKVADRQIAIIKNIEKLKIDNIMGKLDKITGILTPFVDYLQSKNKMEHISFGDEKKNEPSVIGEEEGQLTEGELQVILDNMRELERQVVILKEENEKYEKENASLKLEQGSVRPDEVLKGKLDSILKSARDISFRLNNLGKGGFSDNYSLPEKERKFMLDTLDGFFR